MVSLLTTDWCPIGNEFYQKTEVYQMKWKGINFDELSASVSPFAGPIALANNKETDGITQKRNFFIAIYTASGQMMNKVIWKSGELNYLCWSNAESLVCVQNDGQVLLYDMFGQFLENKRFSMGSEASEMKIKNAQLFNSFHGDSGLAVLTNVNRFYLVNNVEDPKSPLYRMPELSANKTSAVVSCWTVVQFEHFTKVICCINGDIFMLTYGQNVSGAEQIFPPFRTPVKHYAMISASPSCNRLAFISQNGMVQVATIDVKTCLFEFDSELRSVPYLFVWCGEKAVACLNNSRDTLVIISGKETFTFNFDSCVFIGQEIDGLRIVSATSHEFLREVPSSLRDILSVVSDSPAAYLWEAAREFKKQSYKAHEYLKLIETQLEDAVSICTDAAGHAYATDLQTMLLDAAQFGKAFVPETADSNRYVSTCRLLRVLNSVRHPLIAIPLSFAQLTQLTVVRLLHRLLARRQWPLALEIAKYLKLPPEHGVNAILAHWATCKLQNKNISDEEVAQSIIRKVKEHRIIDAITSQQTLPLHFADIAQKAIQLERRVVATVLLEEETQLNKQVELLLQLDRKEKALSRACDSRDPDLIQYVILQLKRDLEQKGDLMLVLRKFPVAFALYKQQCRQESRDQYKAILVQEDNFIEQAYYWLEEASQLSVFDVRLKLDCLEKAKQCFLRAKDDQSAKLVEDQFKLLKYQEEFEQSLRDVFADLSLRETIIKLCELDQNAKAETLRKELHVTERQFYFWKIESFARSQQWDKLEQFAKFKKSPIGYLPFVELCGKYTAPASETQKYLQRLTGTEEKVKGYVVLNRLQEAADLAFESKDDRALGMVLSHCGPQHKGMSDKVRDMRQELKTLRK